MSALDAQRLAVAKRELLGKLDAATTAMSASSAYVYVWRAREYVGAVAAEVFAEFDYPNKVHSPLGALADAGVPHLDWVDRNDGGETLGRIRVSVRNLMETVDESFERAFAEHLDFLNSMPREYMLATVEA